MSFFTSTSAAVKFENVNDTFTGVITAPVTQRQMKKFGSEELDFWPARNGRPQEPKMEAVINLRDSVTGQERTLYCPKGRMQKAIGSAVVAAGSADLEVGATLTVTHTGTEKGKGTFPAKTFTAQYQRPTAGSAPLQQPAETAAPAQAVAQSQAYVADPWAAQGGASFDPWAAN